MSECWICAQEKVGGERCKKHKKPITLKQVNTLIRKALEAVDQYEKQKEGRRR